LGARLPWGDPEFSARILAEHLDQRHDLASRRRAVIDAQADWLAGFVAPGGRVLDLECGPGTWSGLPCMATNAWARTCRPPRGARIVIELSTLAGVRRKVERIASVTRAVLRTTRTPTSRRSSS